MNGSCRTGVADQWPTLGEPPRRRSAAKLRTPGLNKSIKLLTKHDAQRIAANVAKLPDLLRRS
jgi:hypothetical protein